MAKKSKFSTWPWRMRGLYIVLGISLLLNAVSISFIVYFNSRPADISLLNTALDHACHRDYDSLKADQASDSPGAAILFSEQLCARDAETGQPISGKVTSGHYVVTQY